MFHVLIVDDEAAHRRGLARILNRIRPEYILLEAKDGAEAEIAMSTVGIDIVLTDIRMPNKNGLEFLQDLSAAESSAKVIIISSYSQFDYAKKALTFGAFDFLLKPLDIGELEQALDRAEASLNHQSMLEQRMSRMERFYLDILLGKLVSGEINEEERGQLYGVFPACVHGAMLAIRPSERSAADFAEFQRQWKQGLDPVAHTFFFIPQDAGLPLACLLFIKEELSGEAETDPVYKYLRDQCGTDPDGTTVGVSGFSGNLPEALKTAFEQAKQALNDTFYENENVCVYTKEGSDGLILPGVLGEFDAELSNAVRFDDPDKIKALLSRLFSRIGELDRPSPTRLKESLTHLCVRLVYSLYREWELQEYREHIADFISRMLNAGKLEALYTAMLDYCLLLGDIAKPEKSDIMNRSIRYLEEHFTEDIAMEHLAKIFHFTPSYFSVRFKKHTNYNFSQYLTALRLKEACRLLANSGHKVGEICAMVGYRDPTYFGKVFKKRIGCSPEEYRRRNPVI